MFCGRLFLAFCVPRCERGIYHFPEFIYAFLMVLNPPYQFYGVVNG